MEKEKDSAKLNFSFERVFEGLKGNRWKFTKIFLVILVLMILLTKWQFKIGER